MHNSHVPLEFRVKKSMKTGGASMKPLIFVISLSLATIWSSDLSADGRSVNRSPESFMTCASGNGDGIKAISLPSFINKDECPPFETGPFSCADCVISLEKQGCVVVDVVVTHLMNPEIGTVPGTTYLLSCAKP